MIFFKPPSSISPADTYIKRKKEFSMNEHYPFQNPPLPYAYDALEPYIDEKTMHLHHDRHLQTYVDHLNARPSSSSGTARQISVFLLTHQNLLPCGTQIPIRNNAGGVYNHIFYFSVLRRTQTDPSRSLCPLFLLRAFKARKNSKKSSRLPRSPSSVPVMPGLP